MYVSSTESSMCLCRAVLQDTQILPVVKPMLYCKCLQLMYNLAANPVTADPIARLMHPKELGPVLPNLSTLLTAELPPSVPSDDVISLAAALRQRAYIMKWYALTLLRQDDWDVVEAALIGLYSRQAAQEELMEGTTTGAYANGNGALRTGTDSLVPVLHLLQTVACLAPEEPSLATISSEEQRLQQEMTVGDVSVHMLLTQAQVMFWLYAAAGLGACGLVLLPLAKCQMFAVCVTRLAYTNRSIDQQQPAVPSPSVCCHSTSSLN